MRSLGLNGNTVNLLVAGGVNIVQFLAVFPAVLYIDRWGALNSGGFSLPAVIFFTFLIRAKASAPRRQRCDDNRASAHCLVGMSTAYVVNGKVPTHVPQIFEFGSEWDSHPITAWVAVRYVVVRSHFQREANEIA
jgi:hypothetical protein